MDGECSSCDRGYFSLQECPKQYVGSELIASIRIAGLCENGVMPVAGGLLDQSAYFVELTSQLNSEIETIQREIVERRRRNVGH